MAKNWVDNGRVSCQARFDPEVHNALDRELSQELHDAFREVNFDRECRVMVLSGAGETFCAGDDVKEFNDWKRIKVVVPATGKTSKLTLVVKDFADGVE